MDETNWRFPMFPRRCTKRFNIGTKVGFFVNVAILMPDHLHMLASFPQTGKRIQTILSKWKEWTAKTIGIRWHRDFFEHRLRQDESFRQKADYVLQNPVRAGLVKAPEDWPYVFISDPR